MYDFINERIDELRTLYASTNDPEYRYRFLEAQRILEHLVNEQIRSAQLARRSKSGSAGADAGDHSGLMGYW